MFRLLGDKLHTARLRARYQRLVHERLLELTESSGPQPVSAEAGDWTLLGAGRVLGDSARVDARSQARELTRTNPYAANILRLLEAYVAGPGLKLAHHPRDQYHDDGEAIDRLRRTADRLWMDVLVHNARHYSFQEHARRAWRDGECFVRTFRSQSWPLDLRFVDPEAIGPTPAHPDSQGILTDPGDVELPRWYLRVDPEGGLAEQIAAGDILHTRVGVDSNQKRGVTLFTPVLDSLDRFARWSETELTARRLQAAIVLWRKVSGGTAASATSFASDHTLEDLRDPATTPPTRLQPGSVLTTGNSTEVQFLQPDTNYSDAVPLGRLLLLNVAAGAGLPEFMLTSDASNANYASTMIAEGPAVKMFQAQQQFFAGEFTRFWQWVMSEAVAAGELPGDFFERITPQWCFPELVNRDRPRERHVDTRMVQAGILSRAEVVRREGLDPDVIRREIDTETPPPRQPIPHEPIPCHAHIL